MKRDTSVEKVGVCQVSAAGHHRSALVLANLVDRELVIRGDFLSFDTFHYVVILLR